MDKFTVIIVEDAKLELKGTEEIFRTEIPEADIIGTAMNEPELDALLGKGVPDLLLLDLGLGGSTTVGVTTSIFPRRDIFEKPFSFRIAFKRAHKVALDIAEVYYLIFLFAPFRKNF